MDEWKTTILKSVQHQTRRAVGGFLSAMVTTPAVHTVSEISHHSKALVIARFVMALGSKAHTFPTELSSFKEARSRPSLKAAAGFTFVCVLVSRAVPARPLRLGFRVLFLCARGASTRIRDLADKRLYVPDKVTQWPALSPLIGGSINTRLVEQQLSEVFRWLLRFGKAG